MTELVAKSVDNADIVIIGNGIAGLTAAVEARRLAPDRRVVIITEQSHPTINTPALKQFAIGKLNREQLLAYPAGIEQAQLIHVINSRVEEIHAQDRYISLKGGRGFGYGDLLIATGSAPAGLPAGLPGRDFDGVISLHRLYDYLDLRRRIGEVEEAVVIGGGAHAIETVMSLLYWDIRVHWLIRADRFLSRALDRPASDMVLESIQKAGAQVYTETEVLGIVGRVGMVAGVVTNHQQLIPCQLVLVCTGSTPVTSLARHCDLPMKHKQGILVDDQLRTSVPHVYAAGDVAAVKDPQTGEYAPRAQWYAAVMQGRMAAALMTGSSPEELHGVPWQATRLGSLSMLTVGNVLQWEDTITTLTDSSRGSYRRMAVMDDHLVGYLSLGSSQPDSLAIKRIIDEGLSIRDIKKALLKGTFDARTYLSRRRTSAAQRMITTGKLPAPATPEHVLPRILPSTGPLAVTSGDERITDQDLQVFATPFTVAPIQGERFSAHAYASNPSPAVVAATLIKSPSGAQPTRRPSGKLWSYSSPLPVVKAKGPEEQNTPTGELVSGSSSSSSSQRARKGQFKAPPQAKRAQEQAERHPSSSLWSYNDNRRAKGH